MATAHHPVPTHAGVHHNLEWIWIGLSVVLVALIAGGIAWAVFQPAATVAPLPDQVVGFDYNQEATAGRVGQPGVTGEYFGYSDALYPEFGVAQITDPGEAASLMRSVDASIAASHWATVGGFELDHEATAGHIASPGVTGEYFGYSGVLDSEK